MKYQQPAGQMAGAPYLDGNRNAGIRGSVVPAKAIEHPQRELANLITFAGMTPDEADLDQVRKAIEALIAAATGGGEASDYLLISQARTRLPIFPEVMSADGRINVTSPAAGSVLVPPTVAFQHRGIFPMSTSDYTEAQRTLVTAPSRTYHLRWTPADGFALKDLAASTYNPSVLPETAGIFDSTYDDMLLARIVTSAANVPTITNLANRDRLFGEFVKSTIEIGPISGGQLPGMTGVHNWARTPTMRNFAAFNVASTTGQEMAFLQQSSATRYTHTAKVDGYVATPSQYVSGSFRLQLGA